MATREEQKAMRKKQILVKALELFVINGYHQTTINDIADALSISHGLLFHYFSSKEKLYEELIQIGIMGQRTPAEHDHSDPYAYFYDFLTMLFSYTKKEPWVCYMFAFMDQVRLEKNLSDEIKQLLKSADEVQNSVKIIELGQKQGIFVEGDPYLLSLTFWSCVQGVMRSLIQNDNNNIPKVEWMMNILTGGKKQ